MIFASVSNPYWANILSFLTIMATVGGIMASPLKKPFVALGRNAANYLESRLRHVIREEVAEATTPFSDAMVTIDSRLTALEQQNHQPIH